MIIYRGIRGNSDFTMIELITTSIFVFSSIYGSPTAVSSTSTISTTTAPGASIRKEVITKANVPTKKELEQKAKVYFKDYPVLVEIARCESQFRQYDKNGNVLLGKVNKGDLGIMQINKYYHEDKATELGYDLNTVDGNLSYAKYLYEHEGDKPWVSSSKCWKQGIEPPVNGDDDTSNQVALK